MRTLVTGAAGRLGASVCHLLSDRGVEVRAVDLPGLDYSTLAPLAHVDVVPADLTDAYACAQVMHGVAAIVHLAALLPPRSEISRETTWQVNVEMTRHLIQAARKQGEAHLIFTSSVSIYGDTSREVPPVPVSHPTTATDLYSESKIAAEEIVVHSGLPYTSLRVAGVAVPEFLEPPDPWPFTAEQRLEFVHRDDVALAVANCVGNLGVRNRLFNVAGGPTWQMTGADYVHGHFDVYGLDMEEASYQERPGWFDWYETVEAQRLIGYQRHSWQDYLEELRQAVESAFA